MHSGHTLWDEMCHQYQIGVDSVRWMQESWQRLRPDIDDDRWQAVQMRLEIQQKDAVGGGTPACCISRPFPGCRYPKASNTRTIHLNIMKNFNYITHPDSTGQ